MHRHIPRLSRTYLAQAETHSLVGFWIAGGHIARSARMYVLDFVDGVGRVWASGRKSLISWSDSLSFGLVQPIMHSRASHRIRSIHTLSKLQFTVDLFNMSYLPLMYLWSRNHVLLSFSSSLNGMPDELATILTILLCSFSSRTLTTHLEELWDTNHA